MWLFLTPILCQYINLSHVFIYFVAGTMSKVLRYSTPYDFIIKIIIMISFEFEHPKTIKVFHSLSIQMSIFSMRHAKKYVTNHTSCLIRSLIKLFSKSLKISTCIKVREQITS